MDSTLSVSVVNALWAILVGEPLPLNDPKILKIVSGIRQMMDGASGALKFTALVPSPKLLFLLKYLPQFSLSKKPTKELTRFIQDQVEKHQATFEPDDIRDMMDLFLAEIGKTTDTESSFYNETGYYALINDYVDLFIAGMETTATSLLWIFLHLLHHSDVKANVHKELDQVIGN